MWSGHLHLPLAPNISALLANLHLLHGYTSHPNWPLATSQPHLVPLSLCFAHSASPALISFQVLERIMLPSASNLHMHWFWTGSSSTSLCLLTSTSSSDFSMNIASLRKGFLAPPIKSKLHVNWLPFSTAGKYTCLDWLLVYYFSAALSYKLHEGRTMSFVLRILYPVASTVQAHMYALQCVAWMNARINRWTTNE